MYRVWYSTEAFANFIIDKTDLSSKPVVKEKLIPSDAKSDWFFRIPDHIRKILYLDCPDIIIEYNNEPILCIEDTKEAGTGHNVTQRFARIMAALEHNVPVIYLQPEAVIVPRKSKNKMHPKGSKKYGWDELNPFLFAAMDRASEYYGVPALFYYFPSDYPTHSQSPQTAPHFTDKGIRFDSNRARYAGCPDSSDPEITKMLKLINKMINLGQHLQGNEYVSTLKSNRDVMDQRDFMRQEQYKKAQQKKASELSPATSTITVPTSYVLNYLAKYEDTRYNIGALLRQREECVIYQVDSSFREDPYSGNLAALDCVLCRTGRTFEDRDRNLIIAFGEVLKDDVNQTITIHSSKTTSVKDMFKAVQKSAQHNLLTKNYSELKNYQIPRYYMQVRYGSTYSKVKHVRVFSHLADAILFEDGALWRDA